jgi:PD-(D/E)XK nuclease superfamily protein
MTTLPAVLPTEKKPHSFYQILPDGRIEFYIDASMMKDFSHCESYFHLKHVQRKKLKSANRGIMPFPMAIGSWWSQVMESFYNVMRDGGEITQQDITDLAMRAWVLCKIDDSAIASPKDFESFGDIAGAVLMLNEYYRSQYIIDKQSWKIVGVEEGFGLKKEIKLGETRQCVVYWVGKPDLVVVENGRLTPVDHKTVSRIDGRTISRYKPSSQMPGYVFACEELAKQLGFEVRVDRCVVNICSRSRPSDNPRNGKPKPRFIRAYPNFSREELTEWRNQMVSKCDRLATCIKTGVWNWNETQCHNFYMRPCDFLKLHSSTPSARDVIMLADFEEARPWKPYEPEGKVEDE